MGESKQVKVDNWGIFFLQRLQTFFNKTYFCDLTLQFEDNVQLKVHRLVMNACTEYFQVLEQTCEIMNDCLIMPSDLQADVVVPIVNFMYTGILEFQTSIFDRLYSTARLMNMTVLTKLLDAQKVPISPIHKPLNKRSPISPITWNLQGKKIAPKTIDSDLPEPLPGRKLPIWKRKSVPYRPDFISSLPDPLTPKYFRTTVDETPKPTRFEWPEDDVTNFDTNSFDEISYTSKPIILPQREKSPKPSTSNFEELKKNTVATKRPASPIYNDSKKVNIQDVKEYIKEQKLRSDYIDYDDSEAADNDLQTYENDDTDDETNKDETLNSDENNKSILKSDAASSHNKRVRFSLEGKENAAKVPKTTPSKSNPAVDHTKIITEILKKYPHLVKKNKNIKLKILSKGSNAGLKPVKVVKQPTQTTKVSYMVMKPGDQSSDVKKEGHWSCQKCSNPNPLIFDTYYQYRKHMTEIHQEKVDSQMCNICGHISRKQNLLMYHKFTKHNIEPPPSYQFPKCKSCDYIALSPNMLQRHEVTHSHQNLICAECNTTFPTKTALITHIQLTGHSNKNQTHDCTYCTKKFISQETLFNHIKNNHKIEARRDNLISQLEEELIERKDIITAEEIDALDENQEKPKEKIKILSDVKVTPKKLASKIIDETPQSLEPSSEAESLSNVASGIAASLGLVNTIVVLDENQFILSQDGNQENIIANPQNIILPDNINNIQNLVSQHQVITTDTNTIISQAALNKNDITSTDELVMVLTDHDYSDASSNVITSENSNIVVLYSHPVQGQDGQFISQPSNIMLNSDMSLVEVGSNYAVANALPIEQKQCEESIELIQQEINNHTEAEPQETPEKIEEQILQFEQEKEILQEPESMEVDIPPESEQLPVEEITNEQQTIEHQQITEVAELTNEQQITSESTNEQQITTEDSTNDQQQLIIDNQSELEENIPPQETNQNLEIPVPSQPLTENYEEPMEIEESIEMIKEEIRRNSTELESKEKDVPSEIEHPQSLQTIEEVTETETSESQNEETEQTELKEKETTEDIEKVTEIVEQQEYEPMEVDSSKLPTNIVENKRENQETVIITEEHSENIHQSEEITQNMDQPDLTNEIQENAELLESTEHQENVQLQENTDLLENTELQENTALLESTELQENTEHQENIEHQKNIEQQENTEHESAESQENTEPEETVQLQENAEFQENTELQENADLQETVQLQESVELQESSELQQNIELQENTGFQENTELQQNSELQENIQLQQNTELQDNVQLQQNTELQANTELKKNTEFQENAELPSEIEEVKISQPVIAELEDIEKSIPEQPEKENQLELELEETSSEKEKTVEENIETIHETTQESQEIRTKEPSEKIIQNNKETVLKNPKISNLLDDWDDGDTDSQQSETKTHANVNEEDGRRVVSTLINDWEDEEDT